MKWVVGFVNDSSVTVIQVSPSWAYHFTDQISAGIGPNISIDYKDKKINGLIGFRTFAKAEVWKQRAYLQIEDNYDPIKKVGEKVQRNTHNYLAGGGGVIPISKRFAINIALFYRLNQNEVSPGGNPWVVRIGLSSIKKLND